MEDDLIVETSINVPRCWTVAIILIIVEVFIAVFCIFLMKTPEIYYPLHNYIESFHSTAIYIVIVCVPLIIIPVAIITLISRARTPDRIRKHIYYLKAINPTTSFSFLTKRDINRLVDQLDQLANFKTGYLNNSINRNISNVVTSVDTTNSALSHFIRKRQVYKENIEKLMQMHPEIDFDNPSKQDKETIDDELDVIMYADKAYKF